MDSKEQAHQETNHLQFTRLRMIKNLTVISMTFVLLFTAYDGLSMLQSTMNGKSGIGSYSQAVVYLAFAVSSLLLPKYTIKKLGCKTNLFVGSVLYLPYIAANAYPTWATMMISAVLIGIGASILWAAQCTYFNETAGLYCDLVDDCKENVEVVRRDGTFRKTNLELFIIQNGINEKMLSELKSNDHFIKLDCGKECRTNSNLKVSGNITDDENGFNNKNIDSKHAKMNDVKLEVNNCTNAIQFEQADISSTVQNSSFGRVTDTITKFENLKSHCEHKEFSEKDSKFSNISGRTTNKNTKTTSRSSSIESVTARFFGCFGMMYYFAQIWSNLLTYYVLSSNSEQNITSSNISFCGANFCYSGYENMSSSVDEIPTETRYLLIGITTTLSVLATLLVLVFLDPLSTDKEAVTFSVKNVTATFNHLRKKEQLFIIPLSVFSGMFQGFYTADFTKSYIQCAWDTTHVGLVTVFFGLACGMSSTLSGCVVKYMGRVPVVLLGLVLHLGNDAILLFWNPHPENHLMFYLEAAIFGIVVGIFYSQLQALYGLLFKKDEEVAFASHYFCSAMGWTLSFTYSDYFCTSTKIYILAIMSCVGVGGYFAADRSFRKRSTE